nr:ABC transporter ATP-binding protein [Clostridia bacterium]
DKFTIPSLISRLTSDTYNTHHMIGMMQRLGIRAPILLIGGIVVTLTLEPVLALVLIATLPPLAIVVYVVSKKAIPLYTKVQEAADTMVRKVQENMTGVRVIKALSKSDYETERFDEINAEVVKREQRSGMITSLSNPTMNLLLNTGLTAVIIVGAYRVNAGDTQPGKIIAFLSYFTIILNSVMMINRMFVMLSKGIASGNRIAEVLDAEPELLTEEIPAEKTDKHVVFDNVSFSYNKVENNVTDINFALKRGQTLGIIGATGAGKTTIINLLMRFYDPDKGRVLIDGEDVRSIDAQRLHSMFGAAFQNDFIIADTIRENIDFGRGLTDEQIKKAAAAAQAADFIAEKEGGYDYELTVKGANLSGGQKQRLLVARALAAEPDILILDDSSSALDYKTDAKLRQAINEHYSGITTVIVAQRISSIKHADHIIMLEDGNIIGQGTHEELLKSTPEYKEISDAQMGGALYE